MKNELKRSLKTPGAILMGLGSIIGTGIFVSIAIATEIAGNGIVISIVLAAILATFNGLSSAQLAAAHPFSGGTYEYGYRFLNTYLGFTAGWMFMIAKSASAATAVLGSAGYVFYALDFQVNSTILVIAGLTLLVFMTVMVSGGISRSNLANKVIVSISLLGLFALVITATIVNGVPINPISNAFTDTTGSSIFHGAALMFVAYTGYGRIATLGEEVHTPKKTIPKAIILTMIIVVILYLSISLTALSVMGADAFGQTVAEETAPLIIVAEALSLPVIGSIITIAAITAMLGVLLNLILGLSRVLLGMARRRDMPRVLSRINPQTKSPVPAVLVTGIIIGLLVISGDLFFTWSFSAFTVLIYYSITNLSALMMPKKLRLYPIWIPSAGLIGCLFLTFWIEATIWISGLVLLVIGVVWHTVARRYRTQHH